MSEPQSAPPADTLDFPIALVARIREQYAPDVVWEAPRRGIVWSGRDQVLAGLLREAAAMGDLCHTQVRLAVRDGQVTDEFVARFTCRGAGIERMDLPQGARVELVRLRILSIEDGLVTQETAIETWTLLDRAGSGDPLPSARV